MLVPFFRPRRRRWLALGAAAGALLLLWGWLDSARYQQGYQAGKQSAEWDHQVALQGVEHTLRLQEGTLSHLSQTLLSLETATTLEAHTLHALERTINDARQARPSIFQQVLEVLCALPPDASEEHWEAQLARCGFLALEGRTFSFGDIRSEVRLHSILLLAETSDPAAPSYPVSGGGHFLIITESTLTGLLLFDPAQQGVRTISQEDFLTQWTGKTVLLLPAL